MTPYLITSFEEATLAALIHEPFGYDHADIFEKRQIKYIYGYLKSFMPALIEGKKTVGSILLEHEYIDRDFLEDYSRFYVGRFGNDGSRCARLHFFDCDLTHKQMDALLAGDSDEVFANQPHLKLTLESLQEHYLGFMVIKPLTRTFVGKTCLRVSGDTGLGKKKIAKRYDVNLFGLKLTIDSIAFQEQDKVVAACATTAIWTALHGFPGRSVKEIKSCSEITTAALNFVHGSSNGFPNKELSNKQIQRSLDVEGLRYHNSDFERTDTKPEFFQEYLAAHIDSDLPVILAGTVYGLQPDESEDKVKAGHAITAVGYDFRDGKKWVYVHDDRLGPYARAEMVMLKDYLKGDTPKGQEDRWGLAMSLVEPDSTNPHEIIVPDMAIVPADKKMRLPFKYAYGTAVRVVEQIEALMPRDLCPLIGIPMPKVSFKIKLVSIAHARDEVRVHTTHRKAGDTLGKWSLDESLLGRWREDKLAFLTGHLARLQWQMDFFWENELAFKVFLDATDIPSGNAISGVYMHDPIYADAMLGLFKGQESKVGGLNDQHFFPAFTRALKRRRDDYENHLNDKYGTLRAPNHIKENEVSRDGKGTNKSLNRFWDPQQVSLVDIHEAYREVFEDPTLTRKLIWAIGKDGVLFIAEDVPAPEELGHPSMTGMQAARIAGEIRNKGDFWQVNHFSGRYSSDYSPTEKVKYLKNALLKIRSLFPLDTFEVFDA